MDKKNYFILLGNGFTIDLINHLKNKIDCGINVSNLFSNGELVPWPGNDKPGFLSYRYCPNLWTLGARPNMSNEDAINLIEDIITCANILHKNNKKSQNIYIKAYKELGTYLQALFVYYNKQININTVDFSDWPWFKFLNDLYNSSEVEKIHIVTLNYDIWLERVFKKINIHFDIASIDENDNKIKIYKPHGSISFSHRVKKEKEAFEIRYDTDSNDGEISEFTIEYDNINALNSVNAIIPPAGDSSRLDFKWAKEIRDSAKEVAKSLNKNDELIICGLSYWHVDRLEIDSILTSINPEIEEVKIINPYTPKVFNAIITTLFDKVIFYNNSKPLI
ncbi:SIR2 family protein [Flavobacterium sp. ENC]|uniref:SIR2 family protein n=1 Tax=Flavobacterium sp. ENC TaxID=2897330 RepID=UPI001E59A1BA|nr:SIR2 family protein [Flavobacterium sp. ENC]MCD0466499.1 SIR2 family protein [Flavobacterium sp. ENC]